MVVGRVRSWVRDSAGRRFGSRAGRFKHANKPSLQKDRVRRQALIQWAIGTISFETSEIACDRPKAPNCRYDSTPIVNYSGAIVIGSPVPYEIIATDARMTRSFSPRNERRLRRDDKSARRGRDERARTPD